MIKSALTLFLFLSISCFSFSQGMYGTSNAVVDVTVHYKDSIQVLQSTDVKVALNYETAEFAMFLETDDLRSRSDSSTIRIDPFENEKISYRGRFDLDYIKRTNHPPMTFEVNGDLRFKSIDPIKLIGRGDLVHISDGAYPCQLSMVFKISAKDLEDVLEEPISFEFIMIEIQEVILVEDFE